MPVSLTTPTLDVTAPKTDYGNKKHSVPKLTADGNEGKMKLEVKEENNSGTELYTEALAPICALLEKIQADLAKIETALNKIETDFASHMHPTGMGPAGPTTSPIILT